MEFKPKRRKFAQPLSISELGLNERYQRIIGFRTAVRIEFVISPFMLRHTFRPKGKAR